MRLTVALLSRGHPDALTGVIMSLHRLASGTHQIRFLIGADDDDAPTQFAVDSITEPLNITLHLGPRPVTRGEVDNRLLALTRGHADCVTLMTDRTFPITPGWDDLIARGIIETPNRLLWWSCPIDNVCAIPIIPASYLDACAWQWSPEIFPFWFDDTWNQHIDLLIHGMPSKKSRAAYAGQRGKTTRGRDFAFWIDVFWRLLPLRVEQAREMSAKLNIEWQTRSDVLAYCANWHKTLSSNIASLEATFGDARDPGPEYFEAKQRAERMLAALPALNAGEAA